MIKLVSWNINSIRARIEILQKFLEASLLDILLLQETKCQNHDFPISTFENNYFIYCHGQKSYNGVAIFSKYKADEIRYNFTNNPLPDEARFIEITFSNRNNYYRIISIYIPNGRLVNSDTFEIKLRFFDALTNYLVDTKKSNHHIIIGGDFNVAPFDIDVYSPENLKNSVGFSIRERHKLRSMINSGFMDLYRLQNPNTQEFSWWDYRNSGLMKNEGMRIDNILGTPNVADKLISASIEKSYRLLEKPSDHTPITIEFE